jgi:hypothetical protein
MAFAGDLDSLLSASDEQNVIWRSFLQALHDHGGSTLHLNRLLRDTKEGRRLLNDFAKKVVGRIWELVDQEIDLGEIDFRCPIREFHAQFEHLEIAEGAFAPRSLCIEAPPRGPCVYRLKHFGRPMLYREIIEADLGGKVEHAGWRELIAYAARLDADAFSACFILAAGSELLSPSGKIEPIFPKAQGHWREGTVSVSWLGMDLPDKERYGPRCFFLVRVY